MASEALPSLSQQRQRDTLIDRHVPSSLHNRVRRLRRQGFGFGPGPRDDGGGDDRGNQGDSNHGGNNNGNSSGGGGGGDNGGDSGGSQNHGGDGGDDSKDNSPDVNASDQNPSTPNSPAPPPSPTTTPSTDTLISTASDIGAPSPSTSDSGQPSSASGPNGFKCPFCINDNDARVIYQPANTWFLNSTSNAFLNTTHTTQSTNATVTLSFKGKSIKVFGTIPGGSQTPPKVTYTVDTSPPFQTTQPMASGPISNQPLFASQNLDPNGQHQITITVEDAQSPYILDYFFILPSGLGNMTGFAGGFPGPFTTPSGSNPTLPSVSVSQNSQGASGASSSETTKIQPAMIGLAVVSAIAGICILLAFLLWILRRRRTRSRHARCASDDCKTCLTNGSKSPRCTMFTTTESILQFPPSAAGRSSFARSSFSRTNSNYARSFRSFRTFNDTPPAPPLQMPPARFITRPRSPVGECL